MMPEKKNVMRAGVLLCILLLLFSVTAAFAEGKAAVVLNASKEEIVVAVGRTTGVRVTATPYIASQRGYIFTISDDSIASINQQGKVKGLKVGQCEMTITSKYDETVSITVPVKVVIPVRKITLEAEPKTIFIGETTKVVPSFLPEDATLKEVTFASHNEKIAIVDENGVVTGLGKGRAFITATSKDGTASARIAIDVHQQPTAVTLSIRSEKIVAGKSASIRATLEPRNVSDATVTWTSSDESIATVDKWGKVTAVAPGQVQITAASNADPAVSSSITINVVRLAQTVDFAEEEYTVTINESGQLSAIVGPEDASDKTVTYKSSNPKIVSVDENGKVTALAPGKVTITATSADGSNRRGRCTVNVHVPVTGVSYKYSDVRIGKNQYGTFTMEMEPKKASNRNMTWVSSDESIATVTGTTNKVRIRGVAWGRCQVTGTTEDGGYQVTLNVNIGSLRHAVTISSVDIRDGKPRIRFKNNSDMTITSVKYTMVGYDEYDTPVIMSTETDEELFCEYNLPLLPGDYTLHGCHDFYRPSDYKGLQRLDVVITGWETDTGYYSNDGELHYSYTIGEERREWSSYESPLYQKTEKPEPTVSPEEGK